MVFYLVVDWLGSRVWFCFAWLLVPDDSLVSDSLGLRDCECATKFEIQIHLDVQSSRVVAVQRKWQISAGAKILSFAPLCFALRQLTLPFEQFLNWNYLRRDGFGHGR
jgi:hypothetical protein